MPRAPVNEGMLEMLDEAVLPELRHLAGEHRVTLVMDRECWSPKRFNAWSQEGFEKREGKWTFSGDPRSPTNSPNSHCCSLGVLKRAKCAA